MLGLWNGAHSLCYNTYTILSGYDVQDAVVFAYGAIPRQWQTDRVTQAGLVEGRTPERSDQDDVMEEVNDFAPQLDDIPVE